MTIRFGDLDGVMLPGPIPSRRTASGLWLISALLDFFVFEPRLDLLEVEADAATG